MDRWSRSTTGILFVFLALFVSCGYAAQGQCAFARDFSVSQILQDSSEFEKLIAFWEGQYIGYLGFDQSTGLTFDGYVLDSVSGLPISRHNFSAPSKESLHLGAAALALDGNQFAQMLFFSGSQCRTGSSAQCWQKFDAKKAIQIVIDLLGLKMKSYHAFQAAYPAYGAHLPWYSVGDGPLRPAPGWDNRVPSLDNGEIAWGLYAVAFTLEKYEQDLAAQYRTKFFDMVRWGKDIFMNNGLITTVSVIKNMSLPPGTQGNYQPAPCGAPPCVLADPYEGEMYIMMMSLFGGLNRSEIEYLWTYKNHHLEKVRWNGFQVQRGWWFSAHEQWKYLELPYYQAKINHRVFMNGEAARVAFSSQNKYGGLFASCNIPNQYLGATGVQPLAFETVQSNDWVTPYGAFPTILANKTLGLVWYANMLNATKMQSAFGSVESLQISTGNVMPMVTWDTKAPAVLAVQGGFSHIVAAALEKDGKLGHFVEIVEREWSKHFVPEPSANVEALPPVAFSQSGHNFGSC